jgi:DNA-binding NtrC family response regulator
MTHGTVVLAGSLPVEPLAIDLLVAEFGWSLKRPDGLRSLAEMNASDDVVAVFFDPRSLGIGWEQALGEILEAAPRALPILCYGFADAIEWPQAAEAGAFHSLRMPFDAGEVRQSLAFVCARTPARQRNPSGVGLSAEMVA